MRQRSTEKILPDPKQPVAYCECGKPLYDGRRTKCPACRAALKKTVSKRPSTITRYAAREELMSTISELEDSIRMQKWILAEQEKRLTSLKASLCKF